MTERHTLDSSIGLAGRLSHLPYGTEKAEDCGWQSSRDFSQNAPIFKVLGPWTTWFPATKSQVPRLSTESAWHQSRKQQRWLLKSHPEVHLGNNVLHEHLFETASKHHRRDAGPWHASHFAIGELTDTSNLQRILGAPLLVTSAGSANDEIRLVKPNLAEWRWDEEDSGVLRLAERSEEEPAFWTKDVGPIRQLKCIVDLKRYDPTRWLVVQRNSGTRVFQPEYRRILAASTRNSSREPSRIDPNPIFHISRDQTGGNSHTDVAFNPSTRSRPPQLGIIDERGFWSVWDITLARVKSPGKPKPKLRKCGHIRSGVLERLPYRDTSETRWHRISWVGCSSNRLEDLEMFGVDADEAGSQSQSRGAFLPLERSSMLLLCNSNTVRLLDITTDSYLPDLPFVQQGGLDRVLDVHINLQDPQCFFVLTTSKLFVVRVFSTPGDEWDKPKRQWSILLSSPHFRDAFDQSLKLTVTTGAISTDHVTTLVFIYSSGDPWLDLFCIKVMRKDPSRATCHREAVNLSNSQGPSPDVLIQSMCLYPAKVVVQASRDLSESARNLAEQRVQFYQFTALKSDMCLVSILCASSMSSGCEITPPIFKVIQPTKPKKSRKLMKHLSSRFVVADDSMMQEEETRSAKIITKERENSGVRREARRFLKSFYEYLSTSFGETSQEQHAVLPRKDAFGTNPFDIVHYAVEEALKKGIMPTQTLHQMMQGFELLDDFPSTMVEWKAEIELLQKLDPSIEVLSLNYPRASLVPLDASSLQEIYSKLLGLSPLLVSSDEGDGPEPDQRSMMFRQIACDLCLSTYAVSRRKPDINEPQQSPFPSTIHKVDSLDDMLIDTQPESHAASSVRSQSQASVASSQMSRPASAQEEDPAMTLLRSYTGTGKFVPRRELLLLDKWQQGADPTGYVFDLDKTTETTPGMLRRAKQLARESRKRRRAESLLQISRQPDLPSTQPVPNTHFFSSQVSQPVGRFSQSQHIHSDPPHTMSQPTGGPFGQRFERPKKKAKKRKGGF
ncbi:RNA polymerase I-specific transcription initiation factor RRN6-like protein [Biscogniauxia marginata]|nr:RNA polymerase I-specific transcription initiation factor RRN6-like protein [Biscogniauxia marginata]